jgi:hypothetical protein
MKLGMKYWRSSIAVVMVVMALIVSTPMVFADDINPGVFAIDSQPNGLTYGQWSAKWWEWAFLQTTFDNCPNESGPVWFLAAPTHSNCTIPANTAIMFPTFNVEWSAVEAVAQGNQTPGQTCLVPTNPNGTSYAALLACARAQANNATQSGATLEADVDGRMLQSLTDYRAHSPPPPFTFTAVSGNLFGLPPGSSQSVADGFWIMLMPLSSGKHTLHFAATVPFPNVNPPATPFTFTTEANYCLIVLPSNQTCP